MMTIPVEIRRSPIHGCGVFALKDIPKGTVVWEFTPGLDRVVSLFAAGNAEPHIREYMFERGYLDPDNPHQIVICVDESQFLNFPPREQVANTELGGTLDGQHLLLAAVDIPAGSELTVPPESDGDYERKMLAHESRRENRTDVQLYC